MGHIKDRKKVEDYLLKRFKKLGWMPKFSKKWRVLVQEQELSMTKTALREVKGEVRFTYTAYKERRKKRTR